MEYLLLTHLNHFKLIRKVVDENYTEWIFNPIIPIGYKISPLKSNQMGDMIVSKSSHFLLLSVVMMFRSSKFFYKKLVEVASNLSRLRIHERMHEMYEIIHQTTYWFFGNDKLYKLVMNEIYEISQFIAKFEYEYSRICISSVVRA